MEQARRQHFYVAIDAERIQDASEQGERHRRGRIPLALAASDLGQPARGGPEEKSVAGAAHIKRLDP